MKKIVLIFTGGTISMEVYDRSTGVVPSLSANEIIGKLQNVTSYKNLYGVQFSMIPSPSMTPQLMQKLTDEVIDHLEQPDVIGVVISHGTDTLEETAFYLDLVIDSSKPVVLTGSMKNASELGYDGLTNLVSSIQVVSSESSKDKGVLVVMNYEIHAASEVVKTHTLNLDTFKTLSFGPLGIIDDLEVLYYRNRTIKYPHKLLNTFEDNVPLIKMVTGYDPEVFQFYIDRQAKGIVLEALGRGNVPPNVMPYIHECQKLNIPIVIVSRCVSGRVLNTYGYPGGGKDLVKSGAIMGGDLAGPKARIMLMLALGNQFDYEQIKLLYTQQFA